MKAGETTVKALLDGQKQYVVPLFQRPYSWRNRQWQTLWQDIVELYGSASTASHFIGSIVTLSQSGSPEGITPFLLIDGQQRLTTLCILLAALRDYGQRSHPEVAERIHGLYLENRYVKEDDRFKVLCTHGDRPAFASVVDRRNPAPNSPIAEAYRFFFRRLQEYADQPGGFDPARFEVALLSQLIVVSISLERDDNPYRIFESLNAKGMSLTQSDLLRNYFFMRLPVSDHEELYSDVWKPMEVRLGEDIDAFIRDFLVKDGRFIRASDVYETWKERLDPLSPNDIRDALNMLSRFADYYACLARPQSELHPGVRQQLSRLNRWGGTTVYPFLLNLYEDVTGGHLDKDGLAQILRLIESFLVRRLFARIPTNELNRLFISLYSQLPRGDDLVDAVWNTLSKRRWPTDSEFRERILQHPLYVGSRPEQRKLILETLEESYGHKEPVDLRGLQIEHIMPQNPSQDWLTELGNDASDVHRQLVHTLGNLTLTAYNQELSGSLFERKQQILSGSHLELNRDIAKASQWTGAEIENRARHLADIAVNIWPGPRT